jgi:hypothetical protein
MLSALSILEHDRRVFLELTCSRSMTQCFASQTPNKDVVIRRTIGLKKDEYSLDQKPVK